MSLIQFMHLNDLAFRCKWTTIQKICRVGRRILAIAVHLLIRKGLNDHNESDLSTIAFSTVILFNSTKLDLFTMLLNALVIKLIKWLKFRQCH